MRDRHHRKHANLIQYISFFLFFFILECVLLLSLHCTYPQYKYVISARRRELSGHVRAQAYNYLRVTIIYGYKI